MKIEIAINNYNYAEFLTQCLDSALHQTVTASRIIVVDDGSTDQSRKLLEDYAARHPTVVPVIKKNGGQLSAFNAAVPHLEGDLVCFLDSDDWYEPGHLENIRSIFTADKAVDLVLCSHRAHTDTEIADHILSERTLTLRSLRTLFLGRWTGVPTSMIAFRTSSLKALLPCEFEHDWRVRADDVLIYLASLNNLTLRYTNQPSVNYRIHGNNNFIGTQRNVASETRRLFAIGRLFQPHFDAYMSMPPHHKYRAFRHECRRAREEGEFRFVDYLKVAFHAPLPVYSKLRQLIWLLVFAGPPMKTGKF